MREYYSRRAKDYEKIYYHYDDPERQSELKLIGDEMISCFTNKSVLEVACGTGYWTDVISKYIKRITAFDFSPEVLEIAKSKNLNAELLIDDAYEMKNIKGQFEGGCANFWFSHIPKDKIDTFLNCFHQKLLPGSTIYIADNNYIEGAGGVFVHTPGDMNTYKIRTISDGSEYEILKNYYTEDELREIFKTHSHDIEFRSGKFYWRIKYTTAGTV